ncbi:MAG: methyltransferase domain-containing protein, partial [Methylococcaceae bacterium]|nr:methyltransferase domain-containing protein [Methylococcaceae bacterium]
MPNSVQLESKPCPLGCDPEDQWVLTGRDRLHGLPGSYSIVRCKHCGLMRTDPRPTPETIGYYYPDDYGPYASTRISPDGFKAWMGTVKEFAKNLLRLHTQSLPPLPPGRMLEIGCASGAFLHQMARQGWEVEGIEFSPQAAQCARDAGFKVYSGSLESAPEPQRPYDLVVGWM